MLAYQVGASICGRRSHHLKCSEIHYRGGRCENREPSRKAEVMGYLTQRVAEG